MELTRELFYSLFWENKSCYNLFLLSKGELLDTKKIDLVDDTIELPFPRIIVSNHEVREIDRYQIAIRNEKQTGGSENTLQSHIDKYTPVVTKFLEDNFGKALEKITEDLENPGELIGKVVGAIFDEDIDVEGFIISLLQDYGLAGKHISTFEQLEEYYKREFLQKKIQNALSDETYWNILEFVRNVKNIYLNEVYRGLYESNQVLVNSLHSEDNFESRQRLFELLFEAGVITYSKEETFVECHNCDAEVYRGVLHVKLRPKKLDRLKCPVCDQQVTYFAPFDLDKTIYEVVKSKDGIILDALIYLLQDLELNYTPNPIFNDLEGLELDCIFETEDTLFAIETKMFKLNTNTKKLAEKVNRSTYKLKEDIENICAKYPPTKPLRSIVLVNITNEEVLQVACTNIAEGIEVLSLSQMKEILY